MKKIHYPVKDCIHEIFEKKTQSHPNLIAVIFNETELTYQVLNERANQLARHIEKTYKQLYGELPKSDCVIGILLPKGIDAIIAMLAVLKTGASYLPLDVNYPEKRIKQALLKVQYSLVITSTICLFTLDHAIYINQIEFNHYPSINKIQDHSANNLAYVIFTSGTTGEPNAVAIEHGSVVNLAIQQAKIFEIKPHIRVLQFASYAFDASISEIWCTLLNQGTLCIPNNNELLIGNNLKEILDQYQIDVATIPPSILSTLDIDDVKIKVLILAGEAANTYLVNSWQKKVTKLINAYGPTEATVCATMHVFTHQDNVCRIGLPLPDVEIYLLDDYLEWVALGEKGQIYIGGIGLAREYLYDPLLTNNKFIMHPIFGRVYRTGDMGKYLSDKSIEYIGRIDSQVKIRGYRIDLIEIEKKIESVLGVKQVVVMTEEKNDLRIIAFILPVDFNHSSLIEKIKIFLMDLLPKYMLPNEYIVLDQIPLTHNGKIDKKQLLDIKNQKITNNIITNVETSTIIQDEFTSVCAEVLKLSTDNIDLNQDFFHLGGTSLDLLKLISCLNKKFSTKLSIQEIFTAVSLNQVRDIILNKNKIIKTTENVFSNNLIESDLKLGISYSEEANPKIIVNKKINCILLTGASGFVGINILLNILKQSNAIVFCLIRSNEMELARLKLMTSLKKYQYDMEIDTARIQILLGDLSLPNFGLSKAKLFFLKKNIDCIIHAAAEVNHLYPYEALRKANVLSTDQFIRLAENSNINHIHYISTIDTINSNIIEFDSENSVAPKCLVNWGYIQSKWASENLLNQSSVPFTIYRPGNVTGHSVSGAANLSKNHAAILLKTCIESGIAPEFNTKIEMTPVDYLSEIIVKLIFHPKNENKLFYNLHCPRGLAWVEYLKMVQQLGYNFKIVSLSYWQKEYLANLSDDHIFSIFKPLYMENKINELPLLPEEIKHCETLKIVNQLGYSHERDYFSFLRLYINYYKQSGFIH